MNPDPHQSANTPRSPDQVGQQPYQQPSRAQQEKARLHEEEKQARLARNALIVDRLNKSVIFLIGALEILLGIRFFLRLTGANPDNTFAQTIYPFSAPFVSPFATLFISPTNETGSNIFDVNLVIAMVVYGILGGIALWFIQSFVKSSQ
jgi:hypothetical protein